MSIREDALRIWSAGVEAVDAARLIENSVTRSPDDLIVGSHRIPLHEIRHIEVLGAGKAGAGMALGLENAICSLEPAISVSGWVNVPANCVRKLSRIHLHAARPAGLNEPTAEAVAGTREIVRRAESLRPEDLCIMLISGGGSALFCLPVPEISLQDKLQVTRALAASGAPIEELNAVRSQLSRVKGGRFADLCTAGRLVTLIISDVVGDPVSVIASGPTVPSDVSASESLQILERRRLTPSQIPESVFRYLRHQASSERSSAPSSRRSLIVNEIIGNNSNAIRAASQMAESLGYAIVSLGSENRGDAAQEGRDLFRQLQQLNPNAVSAANSGRYRGVCLLSGGEPTVRLAQTSASGKGGRNQELVLAAVADNHDPVAWRNTVLVSGGTDGEDGPTDAAGAVADESLVQRSRDRGFSPAEYLAIHNSYPYFEQLVGLLKTGPTHTNVMDLRVGLIEYPAP